MAARRHDRRMVVDCWWSCCGLSGLAFQGLLPKRPAEPGSENAPERTRGAAFGLSPWTLQRHPGRARTARSAHPPRCSQRRIEPATVRRATVEPPPSGRRLSGPGFQARGHPALIRSNFQQPAPSGASACAHRPPRLCWRLGRFERMLRRGRVSWGVMPMRDWVLTLAPLAVVMYFLLLPSHFTALIKWLVW